MLVNRTPPVLDKLSAYLIADGAIIAGGYARYLWCIQDDEFPVRSIIKADDIDFWFTSDDDYQKALATVRKITQDGSLSPNGARYHWSDLTYNLIRPDVRPFKNVVELLDSFDFTVCQAALDLGGLWFTVDFMNDVHGKKLVINPQLDITDPLETLVRILKYVGKGFVVDKRVVLRMFQIWDNKNDYQQQYLVNKFNEYLGGSYQ